jgi:hypothetical protein
MYQNHYSDLILFAADIKIYLDIKSTEDCIYLLQATRRAEGVHQETHEHQKK